jgi:hypothetical protein
MQKMVVILASACAIALPSAAHAACSVVGFYSCAAGCGASLKPDWPRVEFVQGSEYRFWNEKGQPTIATRMANKFDLHGGGEFVHMFAVATGRYKRPCRKIDFLDFNKRPNGTVWVLRPK